MAELNESGSAATSEIAVAAAREPLSRERIADTALALTDETGLAGLSMRKLGAELGVEAMSLYHYVTNKDDLLDAILERLYLRIDLPRHLPDDDWENAIRLGLRALHDVVVGHRAALELFSTRDTPSAEAFGVLTWAYARFENVGLDVVSAHSALNFAVSFVMGSAANELGSLGQLRSHHSLDLDGIDDPAMATTLRKIRAVTSDELFDAGINMVVAGLRSEYDLP